MDLGLSGKAFCVVGGSRGIGWEVVRLLAAEGADVAVIARGVDTAATVALGETRGVDIASIAADVTCAGEIDHALATATDRLGRIDGLAVTTHGQAQSPPFAEMADDDWSRQFAEVLLGPIRCVRAVLPRFVAQGSGSIVLTGAYSARAAVAAIAGYAAMKAALVNLTKGLAKAHGRDGVRINAVCPGFVATARAEARLAQIIEDTGASREDAERRLLTDVGMAPALGRLGRPEEIAAMIAFLLSPRASYATGLIANIDGGTDF